MKKLFLILVSGFLLSGCSLISQKSGVEIMSSPSAKVFIDGKEAGMTPYRNNSLKPGEIEVKLVNNDVVWTKKIRLENGTNTVIDREISNDPTKNGGYVLYLETTGDEKKSGLLVSSKPDRASIFVESEIVGYSPIRMEDVGDGDKQVSISYPGYRTVNVFAKGIPGYQLIIEAELPTESPPEPEKLPEVTAPISTQSGQPQGSGFFMIVIKDTETGWLRVRGQPSAMGAEVARVKPGEKYQVEDEEDGWYKIKVKGVEGWISTKYADKL